MDPEMNIEIEYAEENVIANESELMILLTEWKLEHLHVLLTRK